MKRLVWRFALLAILLLCHHSFLNAQKTKLPPFRMMQAGGKIFKAEELPMGKPIVMVYFSPECDHCETLMKELFTKPEDLKNASVVLITYLSVEKVAKFVRDYGLNKHPNVYVGTEGTAFFVRDYYKITDMPFGALHNKNGDFVQSCNRTASVKSLVEKLNTLK